MAYICIIAFFLLKKWLPRKYIAYGIIKECSTTDQIVLK